ncbi:golgin subfamily A member 6-like protein 6 [Macrobrachium nipponense]|uniref:golgin subfamily A member 6-like protein 6 n=1 Tax=Macrobrachium nipponense TaxID=159736 RepID=UPI0030C7BC9E
MELFKKQKDMGDTESFRAKEMSVIENRLIHVELQMNQMSDALKEERLKNKCLMSDVALEEMFKLKEELKKQMFEERTAMERMLEKLLQREETELEEENVSLCGHWFEESDGSGGHRGEDEQEDEADWEDTCKLTWNSNWWDLSGTSEMVMKTECNPRFSKERKVGGDKIIIHYIPEWPKMQGPAWEESWRAETERRRQILKEEKTRGKERLREEKEREKQRLWERRGREEKRLRERKRRLRERKETEHRENLLRNQESQDVSTSEERTTEVARIGWVRREGRIRMKIWRGMQRFIYGIIKKIRKIKSHKTSEEESQGSLDRFWKQNSWTKEQERVFGSAWEELWRSEEEGKRQISKEDKEREYKTDSEMRTRERETEIEGGQGERNRD